MTLSRRSIAWLQAAHAFPTAAVVSLTALIGLVTADGLPDGPRFAAMLLAMLLSQLCIGWTNDYLDRDQDARFQPGKPVPSGLVPAPWLRAAAWAAGAALMLVGAALGWQAWLLLLAGACCGLAYDFGLKRTALSWAAYVLALAILPAYVWTALDQFSSAYLWLYLIALPLPVATHLANTLPDLATDSATGGRGLAVVLGKEGALTLLFACLLLPPALVGLSTRWLDYEASLLLGMLAVYAACVVAAWLCFRSPSRGAAVWGFRLVAIAGLLFSAAWLRAVQ